MSTLSTSRRGATPHGNDVVIPNSTESNCVSATTPEVSVTSPTEILPKPIEFDEEIHALGLKLRTAISVTLRAAVCEVGKLVSEAHSKLVDENKAVKGRGSLYGLWLETYVPTADRKTLDRWRSAYEQLVPLIQEIPTACPDLLDRFEATAIYTLCHKRVTKEHRLVLLRLANDGQKVNQKMVNAIVGSRNSSTSTMQKKLIEIPAGKVTLLINHSDFRQALAEAQSLI